MKYSSANSYSWSGFCDGETRCDERNPRGGDSKLMNIGSALAMTLHLREKAADTSV